MVVSDERTPKRVPDAAVNTSRQIRITPRSEAFAIRQKIFCTEGSGTPPGCTESISRFPVVSADSDHRLLSWQPFGLLR